MFEGPCRGLCPALRAHRKALLGLEVPLRGLHVVPRVVERCTEVVVRLGLCRASARWPRGRPWLLCACPAESRTAHPQPPAPRTRRPSARRAGPASSASSRFRCCTTPPSSASSAAASPSCVPACAASKRQGSPGSSRRTSTSSASSARGRSGTPDASLGRRPSLTAAWRSRSKRGSAQRSEARRLDSAADGAAAAAGSAVAPRPCSPPPSAPPAPRAPPCCPLPGPAAAPAAWRAAAWGRARDEPGAARGRPQGFRRRPYQ